MGLVEEFDAAAIKFSKNVTAAYVENVRKAPSTPNDTGRLIDGIEETSSRVSSGRFEADIESTARSEDGADYGAIIDQASGKKIVPVTKQALANTRTGWGPFASATQSTKHRGWWRKSNSDGALRGAVNRTDLDF